MAKTNRQGQKQCPSCKKWIKGTRTRACPKCGHDFTGKQPAAPETTPTPVEKAANTVTVVQVRATVQAVKTLGGADRLNELLGLIREVGGLRRFKDLLDAISG